MNVDAMTDEEVRVAARPLRPERLSKWTYPCGLTEIEYLRRLVAQAGLCALCGLPEPDGIRSLAVDHDHETGRVRDLLCSRCNTGIGKMRDDPALLRRAAEYIETHKEQKA